MNNKVAIIEGVYDSVIFDLPSSLHRWGRVVWLHEIEVGAKGKFLFFEDGICKSTSLSQITNIIKTPGRLEIYTQGSIYKLRLLSCEPQGIAEQAAIITH
jgi:hypothetical protein